MSVDGKVRQNLQGTDVNMRVIVVNGEMVFTADGHVVLRRAKRGQADYTRIYVSVADLKDTPYSGSWPPLVVGRRERALPLPLPAPKYL